MPWQIRTEGRQVTAFNRANGTRLSFGPTPPRLRAPELLDVKLTDVCSVGCAFCYQDSRPERSHAQLEDVAFIAAQAGEAGVFEVALGGGEVSEYPDFLVVLRLFRAAGVVPNFTTRRMRWLSRHWAEVRELVGGVAVSVGSAAEIRLLDSLISASERRSGQLVAQVVMGTVERPELLALMEAAGAAGIRVTLLGFKDVGRGQTFRPLPYDWWLDDLPQYVACTPVSIDTALAAECPAELEKLLLGGSYHTEEGRFSAYIDAVSMTLAPSSYHAGPVFPFSTDWLAHFAAPDFVQGPPTPQAEGRVRLGFATNSSSSHSLVLFRDAATLEKLPQSERDYLLVTPALKKKYLVVKIISDASEDTPDDLIRFVLGNIGLQEYIEPTLELVSEKNPNLHEEASELLECFGAPESYHIENDYLSYLGLSLSEDDLPALQAFEKIIMRDDMAIKIGWDSNEPSYREYPSDDFVAILNIFSIGRQMEFYAPQILINHQDIEKPFMQRIIDVARRIYGENLQQLARQGFSVADITAITSQTFGNYIILNGTDIHTKLGDFLPSFDYKIFYLEEILDVRLRMTSFEYARFIEQIESKYGSDHWIWPKYSYNFNSSGKQSGFTAEEMMTLLSNS